MRSQRNPPVRPADPDPRMHDMIGITSALDHLPVRFVAYGLPVPQGSKTAFPVRSALGRVSVALTDGRSKDAREQHKNWRFAVSMYAYAWIAQHPGFTPLDQPVSLDITFYLHRPPSIPKSRLLPDRKPDLDKLVRAVGDSLKGLIYTEDSRITSGGQRKRYVCDDYPVPCAVITVALDSL